MPLKKYLDYDGLDYLIQRIPRTKIRVTFDDVFAGETATCSMGTTTYTKTVPATEPYELVFPINELGTWTIATSYLGDDYGTTIEVTAIGQTATGHVSHETTPEGATVLPTDDITTWLKCANIEDSTITTLADVLANRTLFETLIADSNACNYMARSTTWAKVEGAVPTMTSDTTPSGKVIYSQATTYTSSPAWKAFDNDDATYCAFEQTQSVSNYLGYVFTSSKKIKKAIVKLESTQVSRVSRFKIVCSSQEGGPWIDASDWIVPSADNTVIIDSDLNYPCWAFYWDRANTNPFGIITVQFYEDVDVTTDQDAMSLIGKYDYCSNALLSNVTWLNAIDNSDYRDSVLNVSVPKMTSNTAPSGECFSSYDNSNAYRVFDRDDTSAFIGSTSTATQSFGYDFGEPVLINKAIHLSQSAYGATNPKIKLQYSDDKSTWQDASEPVSFGASANVLTTIIGNIDTPHRYWRVYLYGDSGVSSWNTYTVQFYGRASAQTNIIHSAPNDTIYMLENGSQVVLTTTNSDGIGTLDFTQFMDGTYTLYSSVAKDPDNLSNDFSKSIRITKTRYGCTTEAYLIPDIIKTLYWYGWDSGLIEDCISANGWSWSGVSLGNPTHNTNDITLSSAMEGVKSIINGTHKVVVEGVTAVAGVYGMLGGSSSKAMSGGDWTEFSTSGKLLLSKDISNKYSFVGSINGRGSKIHAWWYD